MGGQLGRHRDDRDMSCAVLGVLLGMFCVNSAVIEEDALDRVANISSIIGLSVISWMSTIFSGVNKKGCAGVLYLCFEELQGSGLVCPKRRTKSTESCRCESCI